MFLAIVCNAVWTLQLATMCSIFCVQHLRAPPRHDFQNLDFFLHLASFCAKSELKHWLPPQSQHTDLSQVLQCLWSDVEVDRLRYWLLSLRVFHQKLHLFLEPEKRCENHSSQCDQRAQNVEVHAVTKSILGVWNQLLKLCKHVLLQAERGCEPGRPCGVMYVSLIDVEFAETPGMLPAINGQGKGIIYEPVNLCSAMIFSSPLLWCTEKERQENFNSPFFDQGKKLALLPSTQGRAQKKQTKFCPPCLWSGTQTCSGVIQSQESFSPRLGSCFCAGSMRPVKRALENDLIHFSRWPTQHVTGHGVTRMPALCRALLDPQLGVNIQCKHPEMPKTAEVKKRGEKNFEFFSQKSKRCLKLPELPRNHVAVCVCVGGFHHRQTTRDEQTSQRDTSSKARQNKGLDSHLYVDEDAMVRFVQLFVALRLNRKLKRYFRFPRRKSSRLCDFQSVVQQLNGLCKKEANSEITTWTRLPQSRRLFSWNRHCKTLGLTVRKNETCGVVSAWDSESSSRSNQVTPKWTNPEWMFFFCVPFQFFSMFLVSSQTFRLTPQMCTNPTGKIQQCMPQS